MTGKHVSTKLFVSLLLGLISLNAFGNTSQGLDTVPAAWHRSDITPDDNTPFVVTEEWWQSFGDPVLNRLVESALANNPDASMALRRIDMAKNNLSATRWQYAPTIGVNAGYTAQQSSGRTTKANLDATDMQYFNLGLQTSWEVDIFGRVRDRAKKAGSQVRISKAEYDAVRLSLAASVAQAYINLRMYQTELQVAREHIASQTHVVNITEARHDAGLASKLDVTEAKVVLYSTQASVPALESSIESTRNTIATLLGLFPQQLDSIASLTADLDSITPLSSLNIKQAVALGVPADLLRRRPDIVEAEATLQADAASVGIAKKDFLPTLSINGTVGTAAHRADDLFSKQSLTYSVQPTLSWTIFSGMSRKYNLINAEEQMRIDIDNYNLTVQQAAAEVENAVADYNACMKQIEIYNQVLEQANDELSLSVDLYKNSLSPFTNVVNAQMNVLQYRISLIQAQGNALQSLVTLRKALGA